MILCFSLDHEYVDGEDDGQYREEAYSNANTIPGEYNTRSQLIPGENNTRSQLIPGEYNTRCQLIPGEYNTRSQYGICWGGLDALKDKTESNRTGLTWSTVWRVYHLTQELNDFCMIVYIIDFFTMDCALMASTSLLWTVH